MVDLDLALAGVEVPPGGPGAPVGAFAGGRGGAAEVAFDDGVGAAGDGAVLGEAEGEVALGGDLGFEAVGDQAGQQRPDPRRRGRGQVGVARGEPGGGAPAVGGEAQPYVPHLVDHAERAQPPGERHLGVPEQVLTGVARGVHREAEGPPGTAAGAELQLAGELGSGRDDTEGVDDRAVQDHQAVPNGVAGEAVARGHPVQRAGVVAQGGDVEDLAALRVVEVVGAPVDPAVALGERGGDLVPVDEGVDGRHQLVPVLLEQQIAADGVDGIEGGVRGRGKPAM